jgi:hypothetical protein
MRLAMAESWPDINEKRTLSQAKPTGELSRINANRWNADYVNFRTQERCLFIEDGGWRSYADDPKLI